MSVSANTDAGGFIGNSYANVNIYGIARNGVSTSTTARIMTLGSTEDANAGGFVGYNAGTLKIGMTANGNWEYLSSYEWNEWYDPYYWEYSATNYMNVIGYKCGGFVGNNNGAFNSYVIQNCGKIGTPELDYTSYVQMSLRSANVTASSTAQAKEFMVSGAGSWRRLTYSNGTWSVTTPSTQLPVVNAPTTYAFKVKGTTNTYFFKYGFININTSNKTVSACNDYGYGFVHSAGGFVGYSLNDVSIKGYSFDEGATYPDECYYQTDANSVNRGYVGALNWNFGESYAAGFIGYTLSTSTIRLSANYGSIGLTGSKANVTIDFYEVEYYCTSTMHGYNTGSVYVYLVRQGSSYAFYLALLRNTDGYGYHNNSYSGNFDTLKFVYGSNQTYVNYYDISSYGLYVGGMGIEGVANELEYAFSEMMYMVDYPYYGEPGYWDDMYGEFHPARLISSSKAYSFPSLKESTSDAIYDSYFTYWASKSKWIEVGVNFLYTNSYPSKPGFEISSWTPTKVSPFVAHATNTPSMLYTYNSQGVLGQTVTYEGGNTSSYWEYLCEEFGYW